MKEVIRFDSIPIGSTYYTEEGYLRDCPIVTTCGVFEYANPDGSIRRELRLPEEVFKAESLKTYKGKPVVITHRAGLITKDRVEDFEVTKTETSYLAYETDNFTETAVWIEIEEVTVLDGEVKVLKGSTIKKKNDNLRRI